MAKLLLVDDDASTIAWVTPALEGRGHEVRGYTSAAAALEAMEEWSPDLIVADILMPEIDGLTFTRLTRRYRGVPVMFVSIARKEAEAVIVGAIGYVQKPATADEIRRAVDRVLRRRGERSTILVVDDDPAIRWLYHSFLDSRFEVIDAEHGAAALELLAAYRVDLAIVDVHMPVMSGAELIRKIRSTPGLERLPVIVQTGDRSVLAAPVWKDLQVSHVLEKNDFLDWITSRIEAHLGTRAIPRKHVSG